MSKSVIVIGAGVVGLACGKELSERGYEVFIAEKEQYVATQTSARNSGVIHAGIYYYNKLQNFISFSLFSSFIF